MINTKQGNSNEWDFSDENEIFFLNKWHPYFELVASTNKIVHAYDTSFCCDRVTMD